MEISPIYHNSRPEGKLPAQEAAAFDFLDSLGIDYERVTHELANTMEKCDDVSAVLGVDVCKNLFLCNRQKTNFYLLCMPPHKAFHTKDLSHQIGSARLSFAPEEQLWDLLHCTPGSATLLGLMNDDENRVQLLIDKETYEAEYFSCHPCLCTSTMKLNQAKKVPKRLLRNLLYELFHCKVYRLVNIRVRAGTDAGGVVGERFERENALIREARHFPVPQCDGADPCALASALPLHPDAPEIGVVCRVKARAHRAAHRAKTLDIRADWLVVHSQQRSAARVAQAEKSVRMRSKVRLAVLAVGKLR